jgi:hypothetical protein
MHTSSSIKAELKAYGHPEKTLVRPEFAGLRMKNARPGGRA